MLHVEDWGGDSYRCCLFHMSDLDRDSYLNRCFVLHVADWDGDSYRCCLFHMPDRDRDSYLNRCCVLHVEDWDGDSYLNRCHVVCCTWQTGTETVT